VRTAVKRYVGPSAARRAAFRSTENPEGVLGPITTVTVSAMPFRQKLGHEVSD